MLESKEVPMFAAAELLVLVALGLVALIIIAPIWLIVQVIDLRNRMEEMRCRLELLEIKAARQQAEAHKKSLAVETPAAAVAMPPPAVTFVREAPPAPPIKLSTAPVPVVESTEPSPMPEILEPSSVAAQLKEALAQAPDASPPQLPPDWQAVPESAPREAAPSFNWEQFLGVKLFAWLGGLVAFLGVAFALKYSFDHNLISPQMRVAGGLLIGLGLLVGGLRLNRERYAVLVQSLCAAGVLVLYADFFAAHAYYKIIGSSTATFALMCLVTAVAFFLAVRLDAQVVAVLGLLGGFLTPPLLSTGQDNPLGLFGYLAILDVGLLAVAFRKRWTHLTLLAAVATVVMQLGWAEKFFEVEKINTALAVFLFFAALFFAAFTFAHKRLFPERDTMEKWTTVSSILMSTVGLAFALYTFVRPYKELGARPGLMLSYVFLLDCALLGVAWLRDRLRPVQLLAGGAVFLLLAVWTGGFLQPDLLHWALGFYLLFAVLHSVFPIVWQKLHPHTSPVWWAHLFPPLALLLVLIPLFKLSAPSFLVWPVVLLIDALAILLAVVTMSLAAIFAVFLLTAVAAGCWVLRIPAELHGWVGLPGTLLVIGGFAIFFLLLGIWAVKKVLPKLAEINPSLPGVDAVSPTQEMVVPLAGMTAILPFLLLIMVTARLPLANPSPVYGLAALLVVLLLGVVKIFKLDVLTPITLGSAFALEFLWHQRHFAGNGDTPDWLALAWNAGFAGAFLLFPFFFAETNEKRRWSWIASALSLPLHFLLIYPVVKANLPAVPALGLVPAVCAVPLFAGLVWLVRRLAADEPVRNTLLALFGGAALLFVTLIFPIQFERQWLTVAWALEGAALLWLFHRVPHPGLRVVGVALLVVAFARLALNPAVFHYHARSATRILNWYLYAYGLATACLFAGARLLRPPHERVLGVNAPPLLNTLGAVLAFLLVNIEIADFFSEGATLTFKFSGSLARDMTYSLAWALFALGLLVVGFQRRIVPARRAGMGLMVVTLLKLFFHDLWRLGGLYRIGSFIGLAVVLMLISFIYQRFLSSEATRTKDAAGKESEKPQL
ncbi:MAG: DUF2339 domain-containing protein [Verrucomicrobia bacterium]|nr:DUF2339 domain-containing protein [Verrucomicrobiota bacterium]